MIAREKSLIAAGIVVGFLVAGLLFGGSRLIWPGSAAGTTAGEAAEASEPTEAAAQSGGHEHHSGAASKPAEPSLQLSDDEQKSIGLRTAVVERRRILRELVAPARVEEPETELANISSRVSGRIDKLYVDFTGQPIRRGQAVAEIYSPEVFSSAEEYRLALASRKWLGSAEQEAQAGADEVIAASRRRLELWGLTPQQIDAIATTDKPQIDLAIYSPVNGTVKERKVTQGQYVNAGDALYSVTDLSTVWVKADIYESDLPRVHLGQSVEITSQSLPGMKLRGRVGFLDLAVNEQSRTTATRIQVANPGLKLRPGMFVETRFAVGEGESTLAVPRSAVVNTGERNVVYVAQGNGSFQARAIELGTIAGDYYPVLSGLQGGERIVTEGNFLLDSQTRLSGGMSGMFGGSKEFSQQQAATDSGQWKVTFRTDPAVPKGGSEATAHVSIQDSSGKPVTDAAVRVTLFMPAMPAMGMGEMREIANLNWKGDEYAGAIRIQTPGTWTVTVDVSRGGQALTTYRSSLNAR